MIMTVRRILYVEDNFQNKRLVRKILASRGFTVLEAEDGFQAVDVTLKELPDLILMDINIGGIDGMEATRRIRAMPETQHIPIIAVTANAMVGDREKIIAAGCTDYLPKPVNLNVLVDTVRKHLGEESPK
jgi:CheY-like chemotaxis protein